MNKRQTAALETRRKLITAGLELIKEKGFDAINVEDITKRAGVAKGTFYTYFKRKEDIVLDISRVPFREIAEELQKMEYLTITKKIHHYFNRFMECVECLTYRPFWGGFLSLFCASQLRSLIYYFSLI